LGDGARIGSGSVVVTDVPPNSVVVGVPGRVTFRDGKRTDEGIDLEHDNLPDPVVRALQCMLDRVRVLEQEVETLRRTRKGDENAETVFHPYEEM
jgi:serine O-acetyltransferase